MRSALAVALAPLGEQISADQVAAGLVKNLLDRMLGSKRLGDAQLPPTGKLYARRKR
jgi:hypothetical protein